MLIAIAIVEKIWGLPKVAHKSHELWVFWRIFGSIDFSAFLIWNWKDWLSCIVCKNHAVILKMGPPSCHSSLIPSTNLKSWHQFTSLTWKIHIFKITAWSRMQRNLWNQRFFKTPRIHENYMQSLVILRSFLQWRWQWASIGHFVFLSWKFHS